MSSMNNEDKTMNKVWALARFEGWFTIVERVFTTKELAVKAMLEIEALAKKNKTEKRYMVYAMEVEG
jgi:hypothetical protein